MKGWLVGIAMLAAGATWMASTAPDGLNRVAADLGFATRAITLYRAPLAGYAVPGLPGGLAGSVAGVAGAAMVGAMVWAVGRLLARR